MTRPITLIDQFVRDHKSLLGDILASVMDAKARSLHATEAERVAIHAQLDRAELDLRKLDDHVAVLVHLRKQLAQEEREK